MLKITKIAVATLLITSLFGCSTTIELNQIPMSGRPKLNVIDNRSNSDRTPRAERALSFFADIGFTTPPLKHFITLLDNALPAGQFTVDVQKFQIIDFYPRRWAAGTGGAMAGALASLNYYPMLLIDADAMTEDNFSCMFSGSLQSKPITASVVVPYKISPFAGQVINDPDYKRAANSCLSRLADKVATAAMSSQ